MNIRANSRKFMRNRIMSLLAVAVLTFFSLTAPAFAAGAGGGVAKTDGTAKTETESVFSNAGTNYYGNIQSPDEILGQTGKVVTVDDATNWVDRKGSEVITLVQHFMLPTCVVGFFLCLALTVVGAIGNKRLMVSGIIGMLICGVCFAVGTCGTQIVQNFAAWLMS